MFAPIRYPRAPDAMLAMRLIWNPLPNGINFASPNIAVGVWGYSGPVWFAGGSGGGLSDQLAK